MTFESFMSRVNSAIAEKTEGLSADDFADAPWYDLYESLGEDATSEDIFECLAEWDDIFRSILNISI